MSLNTSLNGFLHLLRKRRLEEEEGDEKVRRGREEEEGDN